MSDQSDDEYNFDANTEFQSVIGGGGGSTVYHCPSTDMFNNYRDDTMQSRMGRTTAGESIRPMTAIGGAGFQSQSTSRSNSSQPRTFGSGDEKSNMVRKQAIQQKTPQEVARQLEKEIHKLIEESSILLLRDGELFHALQKAELATKKEKVLAEHRKSHSLPIQQGQRLSFATWFHLAKVNEGNKRYEKAVETYESMVKQKRFKDCIIQIRINMGNIFYKGEKFPQAIRMYRMALDQTTHGEKDLRVKILRNIGNAFVKLGKLRDAILSYEGAIGTSYDTKSCFNLISCYVKLGDDEKSKQTLFRMINGVIKICHLSEEADGLNQTDNDEYKKELNKKQKNIEAMLHTSARLVAHMNNEGNWVDNFLWVHEQLQSKFPHVAFQVEIERAIEHLQRGEFSAAVKIFKSYENNDIEFKTMVSTNLSFFYFLEGNYRVSDEYADIALSSNKYNPNALVNKGNCLFIHEDYAKAREFYLEAISINSTCLEAIYNLALTNIRLGQTTEAMQSFAKLHTVSSNDPHVLYQVANLYEEMGDKSKAIKWFNVLCAAVPTDPGVLSRLGQLFLNSNNESQSFHYHLESFRSYPSDIDVIGWLAIWFVKHEMFEKSIYFFVRASQIQPKEMKWKMMVATCYRKMGKDKKAFKIYKNLLKDDPHNSECLKHLISICQDLGESYDKYERELEGILQKGLSPRQHSSGYSSIEQPNETHVDGESTSDSDEFFDDDVNVLLS